MCATVAQLARFSQVLIASGIQKGQLFEQRNSKRFAGEILNREN